MQSANAAAPAKEVDTELLEFLGSLDGEEDGWQEYLEQRSTVAAAVPEKTPPRTPASQVRTGDSKQVKDK